MSQSEGIVELSWNEAKGESPMKRFVTGLVAASVAIGLLAGPVLALAVYSLTFTAAETLGNEWTTAPMLVGIDNAWYQAHGYISYSGMETRVKQGDTELPHLVSYDKIAFVPPLIATNSVSTFTYTTGNTPRPMAIVTGTGGYLTTPDDRVLDLGNVFTLDVKGYLLTDWVGSDIVRKVDSLRLFISDYGALSFTTGVAATSPTWWGDVLATPYPLVTTDGTYVYLGTSRNNGASWVRVYKLNAADLSEVGMWETIDYTILTGLTYDDFTGRLFVSTGNYPGRVFSISKNTMTTYGSSGDLTLYAGLTSGHDGHLYGSGGGIIYQINAASFATNYWANEDEANISSLYVAPGYAGALYAQGSYGGYSWARVWNIETATMETVSHYDATQSAEWGTLTGDGGFLYLGMVDGTISKLDTSGPSLIDSWTGMENSGVAASLQVDANDTLWAAVNTDPYSYPIRVYKINPTGMDTISMAALPDTPTVAQGMTLINGITTQVFVARGNRPGVVGLLASDSPPVTVTATGLNAHKEYTISVQENGSTLKIFVDGVQKDSATFGDNIAPGEGNDWVWMSDATPYLRYIRITKSGADALHYEPNWVIESDNILSDQAQNRDGFITWGTTPEGIDFAVGPLQPSHPAVPVVIGVGGVGGILPGIQAPPTMYTEGDTSKVPFGAAIDELLGVGDVPKMLWWFPFAFLVICILSLLIYEATTRGAGQTGVVQQGSILTMCIVVECLLILFGILGEANVSSLIPLFPALLFPIPASAITLSVKHVGWG
jgi:hypothetical protein